MAFLSKVGNMLKQTASRKISNEFSASRPSIYQAMRSMSTSKVFVGGLSFQTDDMTLKEAFSKYGDIIDARIIIDREHNRSRGFGFITYTSPEQASSAIQAMDGQNLDGRRLRVNFAHERTPGGGFGGGGYGGGGNYGSGDGGYGGGGNYGSGGGGYGGGGNYGSGGGGYGGGNTGGNVGYTGGDAAGSYANDYGAQENTGFGVGAGGYDGQQSGGNFLDDGNDDFAKRA